MRLRHVILIAIFGVYFLLGGLFALRTPAWQAPDEPAHYNYIRFVATTGRFPVLQMGDYPHGYLEEIKARKFPADLGIEPIRYEFHQPPLYYVLLAPIYRLARAALLPLRLTSVLLGAGVALLAYAIARRVWPGRPHLALGTTALVAFLPQHLATVAQVGNDVLAELLFAAVLYLLIGWVIAAEGREQVATARTQRGLVVLGVLLGLIFVTKTTAYIAAPLAAGVLLWRWRRERAGLRRVVIEAALVTGPLLVIGLPWVGRNLAIYGWPDFLGLIRHDQIVVGQTRTGEYLAQVGTAAYLRRAIEFTFKSFWGVFGWLGVFMDSRVYFALALLSGAAAGGIVARGICSVTRNKAASGLRGDDATPNMQSVTRLLVSSVLLTCLTYAWYNAQFVQHQGRYLFTALIPLAMAFAGGWEAATAPRAGRVAAAGGVGVIVALAAWGILSRTGLPKWPIALTGLLTVGFVALDLGASAGARLFRRPMTTLSRLAFAAPFCLLPILALYALFGAIVPQLAR